MSHSTVWLSAAALLVGSVANLIKVLPQFVLTVLRGRSNGVSAGTLSIAVCSQLTWLAFAIATSNLAFGLTTVVILALSVATLAVAVRDSPQRSRAALAVAGFTVGSALLLVIGDLRILEWVASAQGLVYAIPQFLLIQRGGRDGVDLSGLARSEYQIALTSAVAWVAYWMLQGHLVAATAAFWSGAMRAIVLRAIVKQRLVAPAG